MQYRKLGDSDLMVSTIGHGTWPMGGDFFGETDEEESISAIHASLDAGVNLIDTAAGYGESGQSERIVGKAVKGRRDKVIIATKLGVLRVFGSYVKCLDPNVMRHELEASLKRLGTDYIDLYQIHWPDNNNSLEDALDTMLQMKKEGKIRAVGVSNFSVEELRVAVDRAGISSVQPPLSLLNQQSLENGVIPFCVREGLGILAYGSLGGGILTGKKKPMQSGGKEQRSSFYNYYQEPMWSKCGELVAHLQKIAHARGVETGEVAMNWVLAQQGVTCALMGARTPQQATGNAKTADWQLSGAELTEINTFYQAWVASLSH